MLVSRNFLKAFAYVANFYGWSNEDVEEAKRQTRASPELKAYWEKLAAAHQAGYRQTESNNWQRLESFLKDAK